MLGKLSTFVCIAGLSLFQTATAQADPRVALIIGNSGYRNFAPTPFATADATAVSETLRAAGYEVTDIRDLVQADTGRVMREFLDKVAGGGAETDAFVYFSGYGAQVDSENYLIPVDATIRGEADVANEAFRLNDFLNELAQAQAKTKIVVVDAARDHKIPNVVKGLAITEVPAGMLVGFASAPATPSIEGEGPYSLYAAALVSQMRDPSLEIADVFKTARMNVNKATNAAQIPWSASALSVQFYLFATEQTIDKNAETASLRPSNRIRSKQDLGGLPVDDAYQAVIELDTLKAYQWFVELYPKDPRSAEIWEIINKRREALLWRRSTARNTNKGYWNYIKRYPQSPYVYEARERLRVIGAPIEPPPDYIPEPEPLPEGYIDEAVGVPEMFIEGMASVFSVFEPDPPIFIPEPIFIVRPPLFGIRPVFFGPAPFFGRGPGARWDPPFRRQAFNNLRMPQRFANTRIRHQGGFGKQGLSMPTSRHGAAGMGGQRPFGGRSQGLSMPPSTRTMGGSALPGTRGAAGLPAVPQRGAISGRPVGGAGAFSGHTAGQRSFGPGSRSAFGGRTAGGRSAMGGRTAGGRSAFGGRSAGGRSAYGGRSAGGRSAYGGRSAGGRSAYGGRSAGGRSAFGGRSAGGRSAYGGRSAGGRSAFGGRSAGGRSAYGGRSMGGRSAFGGGRSAYGGGGRSAFGGRSFGGGGRSFGGGGRAFGGGGRSFGGGGRSFGGGGRAVSRPAPTFRRR